MREWFIREKEFLITGGVIVAALFFLGFFTETPALTPILQEVIVSTAVFLILPILYCKIVMHRPLSELGFQTGFVWAGLGGTVLAVGIGLVMLFGILHFTPLLAGARLPALVEENFFVFLLYEILLNGFIVLLFEVFFRGFVLLFWLRRFGFLAVIAQALLFASLVFLSGSVNSSTIPFLIFSPLAGLVAYQSRSLLASWGASWFFIFLSDAILLIAR